MMVNSTGYMSRFSFRFRFSYMIDSWGVGHWCSGRKGRFRYLCFGHELQTTKMTRLLLFVQVLNSLFGARLSSLILTSPSSGDITEGSAGRSFTSSRSTASHAPTGGLTGRQEAVPQFFLDFLQHHNKVRRRSRSRSRHSVMGGRGCFGMKIDRIGAISGLGC